MKSLMKIYVKYIAAALTTILAFILLQLVILGVVTAKIYGSGNNYGKYSIAQAYDKLSAADKSGADGQTEAAAYLEEIGASFAMLLDQGGGPLWMWQVPEHLNHAYGFGSRLVFPLVSG